MRIAISSPFAPHDLADLFDQKSHEWLPAVRGASATPVVPLIRSWHESGHTISVVCLDRNVPDPIHLVGERLSVRILPKRRFRESIWNFYREERKSIRIALELEKPDVISAQWSYEHALGALDTGIPTAVTCHDTPLRYAWISKNFFMCYHVLVAASVFRRAAQLIAVSPYTADHIKRFFRTDIAPLVIPNGLSMEIFHRGQRKFGKNSEIIVAAGFKICCVGGWGKIKNVTSLLRGFQLIHGEFSDATLHLFGGGLGEGEEAEAWAKKNSLDSGVNFVGKKPHPEILDFLEAEADLMIHPSLVECHPMVLIEAIACGVPVVAGANSGGVAWTLKDGKYGALCDVRDPRAIAGAALEMMKDPEKLQDLTRNSWEEIRSECGIESVADRYLRVFNSLVS